MNLEPGEPLVVVRSGPWRLLLPMRHVERVYEAALPSAVPSRDGAAPPLLVIAGAPLEVFFVQTLFGAKEIRLRAEDKVVLLRVGERRAVLWVDAVEELVPFEPCQRALDGAAPRSEFVAAICAAPTPLAVLDVLGFLKRGAADSGEPMQRSTRSQP